MARPTRRNYQAWGIHPKDYPSGGTNREQIHFLLRFGVLAPSTHNTQPWNFDLHDSSVTVSPDMDRRLPYGDADNRAMFFSLGCCVMNILVAADYFGWSVSFKLKNSSTSPCVVLDFSKDGGRHLLAPLLGAISRRRSHKVPFAPKPLPPAVIEALHQIKHGRARVFTVTDGSTKRKIGELHFDSTMKFSANKDFSREVSSWMRANRTRRHDGMPGFTFGLPSGPALIAKVMTMISPKSVVVVAKKDREILQAVPAIGMVVTDGDSRSDQIDAGLAYQHAGLILAEEGIFCAPKAAAIQSNNGSALLKLAGVDGVPHLYFGFGYGDDADRHTPRRPLHSMVAGGQP